MPKKYDQGYWKSIKYFKPQEFNQPDYINPDIIMLVDQLRGLWGYPITITSSYASSGHSEKSQHYEGNALDITSSEAKTRMSALNFLLTAEKLNFGGIGLYIDGFPNSKYGTRGLHIDVGPSCRRWGYDVDTKSYVDLNAYYISKAYNK